MSRKTVLMICSWLDHKSPIGIFFREQAGALLADFDIILININEETTGFRTFLKNRTLLKADKHLAPEGVVIYYLRIYHFWFFFGFFKEFFRKLSLKFFLNQLKLNKEEISLIHAQSLLYAGFWAYFIHTWFKIPYILTEHNQISFYGINKEQRTLVDKVLQSSRKNLVVSLDKIRQFAANGVFSDFFPIGNFVDQRRFHFVPKQRETAGVYAFTTIGAFAASKDQQTLLKAIERVASEMSDRTFVFHWVGFDGWSGDNGEKIKSLLSGYHFSNLKVNLIGTATRDQIAHILQNTDLFLFSSIVEGMPVSVLEALSCGVPVISTNCGGVEEVINSKNGRIVPIKDFEAMACEITKCVTGELTFDKEYISKSAIEKFGSEAFRTKLSFIYREALGIIQGK